MSRTEIQAAYRHTLPKIPGKTVRFFYPEGSSRVEAEVFAAGSDAPEWSAERRSLEDAVAAVRKQYGLGVSEEPGRPAESDEQL